MRGCESKPLLPAPQFNSISRQKCLYSYFIKAKDFNGSIILQVTLSSPRMSTILNLFCGSYDVWPSLMDDSMLCSAIKRILGFAKHLSILITFAFKTDCKFMQ